MTDGREQGSGLVELILAIALTVVAISLIATTALGRLATSAPPSSPGPGEVPPLLREAVVAAIRSARGGPEGPAVAAAGPDHLVLRTGTDGAWWRLTLNGGTAVVDDGFGLPPGGPAPPGAGRIVADGLDRGLTVTVRDRWGRALDPEPSMAMDAAAMVEIATAAGGTGAGVAVALREPGRPR